MNTIFVDSLNWLEYAKDSEGNLWLLDYPHSEMHGDGPRRQRQLVSDARVLQAFEALLHVMARHTDELHANSKTTQPHLSAIGGLASAFADGKLVNKSLSQARRTFGWSFLPEAWGESVESAWAKFIAVAENAT